MASHQHNHRQAQAYAGQRHGAHPRDVADVDPVYDVIEHIDELGRHGGHCQLKHEGTQGSVCQGLLILVSLSQEQDILSSIRVKMAI